LEIVRQIALDLGLSETIKWGGPVYVHKGNVVGLGAFKNWVSIWFFNGVFLADEQKVLLAAQDTTKAMRQWRFKPEEQVPEELMKRYISEAIANDENGLKVTPTRNTKMVETPEILMEALRAKPTLLKAYQSMSASHKREYSEYVNEAKKEETKHRRVQKCIDLIAEQKDLNHKYKK